MTCRTDECRQGHRVCPTPDACADAHPFRPIRYAMGYLSVWLKWRDHAASKRAGHLAAITLVPQRRAGWINWKLLAVLAVLCAIGYAVAVWWN